MKFDEFRIMHSDVIGLYQFIESDLKTIYFLYDKTASRKEFDILNKSNLGTVIRELKQYDERSNHPLLKKEFYDLLNEMREQRNYWCHQVYIDFAYAKGFTKSKEFENVCIKLNDNYEKLSFLQKQVEKIRIKFFEYNSNKNK